MIGTGEQATPYIITGWSDLMAAAASANGTADNMKYFKCDSGLVFDLDNDIDPQGFGIELNFGNYKEIDFNGAVIQNGRFKFIKGSNNIFKRWNILDINIGTNNLFHQCLNTEIYNSKFKAFSETGKFVYSGKTNFNNCEIAFIASTSSADFSNIGIDVRGCSVFVENAFISSAKFNDCDIKLLNAIQYGAYFENCFVTGSAKVYNRSGTAESTIFDLETDRQMNNLHSTCIYNSDKFIVPEGGTLPTISGATFLTTAQIHDPQSLWNAGILIPH